MNEIIDFLNKNSGAFLFLATTLYVLTTGVYVVLTNKMLRETIKMRESQTEPRIFINVQPVEGARFILNMVVHNIGPGAAYNLRFKVEPDITIRTGRTLSDINLFKQGFKYLAPNQKLECMVANSIEEAKKEEKILHKVSVSYQNKDKRFYAETFVLDFTEYFGMRYADIDPYKDIVEKIEAIHQDLDKVTRGGLSKIGVVAYTKEEQDEAIRKSFEEYSPREQEGNKEEG